MHALQPTIFLQEWNIILFCLNKSENDGLQWSNLHGAIINFLFMLTIRMHMEG